MQNIHEKKEKVTSDKVGSNQLLPILAISTGQIIWGFSYLFTKLGLQVTSPEILLSIRFFIALTIMNILILLGKGKISLKGKKIAPLIIFTISEPTYFFFESYGILYTNATFSGVVLAASPVAAIILAMLFLHEYPTKRQGLFCLLPIAGVIIMTISGSSLGIVKPIGLVCLLGTWITSAVYKMMNRKTAEQFTAFERTYFVLLASFIVFTTAALHSIRWDFKTYIAPVFNPQFIIPVIILSVFCSVLSNMLVNYAAGRMPVVKQTAFSSLTTLCSMFAGVIFLKEPMSPALFAGAVLILVGIWQVTKQTTQIKESAK